MESLYRSDRAKIYIYGMVLYRNTCIVWIHDIQKILFNGSIWNIIINDSTYITCNEYMPVHSRLICGIYRLIWLISQYDRQVKSPEEDKTDNYESMSTTKLREIAKEKGIKNYSKMSKAELLKELDV